MNKDCIDKYMEENPFLQLSDVVFNILADEISCINLKPGTKLNISKISDDLKISRTPVREAMLKLNKEGFVEKIPDKTGFYVSNIGISDVMKICFIRSMIESKAAYLCARQTNCPNHEKIKELADFFKNPLNDPEKLFNADCEFHKLIIRTSENEYLINFYKSIENKIRLLQRLNMKLDIINNQVNTQIVFVEHSAIANSILLNMPQLAEKEMIHHVYGGFKTILINSKTI